MKQIRLLCAAWAVWLILSPAVSAAPDGETPDGWRTSAKAAVVMEMKTGRILFDQNGEERLAQASTTKIMTTLLALEETDIDTYFTVDSGAIHVEGSSMGLQEGDRVSLRQLCYGMILPSGNDAANATAVYLGGDIPSFAALMNERAAQLGLTDTHFVTPSGLDAPGHYTTARELAALARYAMGDATFREICSQYSAKTFFGNPPYERWLNNYNKLLDFYEPCIGVKTGFTDDAGRVLVSAAAKDGVELICVTMNDSDDWADHQRLYETYFSLLTLTDVSALTPTAQVPVTGGTVPSLTAEPVGDLTLPLLEGEYERLRARYCMPAFEYAPLREGALAGTVSLWLDGEELITYAMGYQGTSDAALPEKEPGLWERLQEWLKNKTVGKPAKENDDFSGRNQNTEGALGERDPLAA